MAVVRKISRVIAIVLAAFLVVGCSIGFFITDGKATNFPQHGDEFSPMVEDGSLVGIRAVAIEKYEVGDIACYRDTFDDDGDGEADRFGDRVMFRVSDIDTDNEVISGTDEHSNTEVSYALDELEGKVVTNRNGWATYYDFFGNMLAVIISMIVAIALFIFSVEPQRPGLEREKREKARSKAHR